MTYYKAFMYPTEESAIKINAIDCVAISPATAVRDMIATAVDDDVLDAMCTIFKNHSAMFVVAVESDDVKTLIQRNDGIIVIDAGHEVPMTIAKYHIANIDVTEYAHDDASGVSLPSNFYLQYLRANREDPDNASTKFPVSIFFDASPDKLQ